MTSKVFISTVGTGSRLGDLTKYLNKSLLSVGTVPVLSRILEKFPKDSKFIITTGHRGDLVKEYLQLAHPDLDITTVDVFPYEGPGSSLGYSFSCVKDYLQEPFYFCSCDTLFLGKVPEGGTEDWVGISHTIPGDLYRGVEMAHYREGVCLVLPKGDGDFWSYIGLAHIYNYKDFWKGMDAGDPEEGEVAGLDVLDLYPKEIEGWVDTGCLAGYLDAQKKYPVHQDFHILPKVEGNETLWIVGDKVIKYFNDPETVGNRVIRAEKLRGFVPDIIDRTEHMYSYKLVPGKTLSCQMTLPVFRDLLDFARTLWVQDNPSDEEFQERCLHFYKDKTEKRVQEYFQKTKMEDRVLMINGVLHWDVKTLLEHVPWDTVKQGVPVRFHGDFHNENIIYDGMNFTFLDWRQDFGGSIENGDIFYDLAKLHHGLIVNEDLISQGMFKLSRFESDIDYILYRQDIMVKCEEELKKQVGPVWDRVQIITALIFLNICGLHEIPYGHMLFAIGVEMLQSVLVEKGYLRLPDELDF